MRRTFGLLATGALLLSGCGGSAKFANRAKPPDPVQLTVYINDRSVSLSPGDVGAGPVTLTITNQASSSQSLTVRAPGSGGALATTGPINPQATTEVNVDLSSAGSYQLATGGDAGGPAAAIRPATLRVGPARADGRNALLVP